MQHTNSNQRPAMHCLLWALLVPHSLLLILNVRSWLLIQGEAGAEETFVASWLGCFQVLFILAEVAVYLAYRLRYIRFDWTFYLASFMAHVAYMWAFTLNLHDIIPSAIQPWIVNEGNVGRWNFTLMMPGAFCSLYALTKAIFNKVSSETSIFAVVVGLIGIPVLWYLLVSVLQPLMLGSFTEVVMIVFSTALITLFLAVVIRLFDNFIFKDKSLRFTEKHYVLALILGLAAPLGGLYLNKIIPFPVDFQSTVIYALTVLNGLILMWKPGAEGFASIRLFLRFLTLPFIAYFFLVFLPFLPLSLFAIIAMGAGFLMLTPLALGLFQGRITYNDYALVCSVSGPARARAIALMGFLIIPVYFTSQIYQDKAGLDRALAYFYANDMESVSLTDSEIERAVSALMQLRDRKAAKQLPYIAGVYNHFVFGDMVLPDAKIERMYRWLTNADLPKTELDFFGSPRSRSSWGVAVPPKKEVEIASIDHELSRPGGSTVRVKLRNYANDTHSLYTGKLHLPEGVFATGMKLKIEDEWVAARVFDRKTALWVFEKITEVRRDPALLIYRSLNELELRVYPFPAEGIREVELKFEYNPLADATIDIGGNVINLNPTSNKPQLMVSNGLILKAERVRRYAFERKPYLHFILDYSLDSKHVANDYLLKIIQISKTLGVEKLAITAANVGSADIEEIRIIDVQSETEIVKEIEAIQLAERGGFWIKRALASEILRASNVQEAVYVEQTPIFVVLAGDHFAGDVDISLKEWHWLIPDMEQWYLFQNNTLVPKPVFEGIGGGPVAVFKRGETVQVASVSRQAVLNVESSESLAVYSLAEKRFVAFDDYIQSASSAAWRKAAEAWKSAKQSALNPASLEKNRPKLLSVSRDLSVLLPSTALIVVESDSQWKMLERKEKQSLSNHSGLEFEEKQASEPAWWLMALILLIFVYWKERKSRRFFASSAEKF